MEPNRLAEIISAAVDMENEGMRVYEDAAGRTAHAFAREMFRSLANDERRHAEWLDKLGTDLGAAPSLLAAAEPEAFARSMREVFAEMRQTLEGAQADADDIQAIDLAMGLEQEAYNVYTDAAAQAADPAAAELLRAIAEEENNHYRILDDTRLYLTDPEKWNIKEENPLIDG